MYYEINDVKSESSEQNMAGREYEVSQLAIDVALKEDLFVVSRLSEDLQKELDKDSSAGFGYSSVYVW